MNQNCFKIILLIARPAAGKSEIIHYLKSTGLNERIKRFHIGVFDEIDDFPMLWTWFEEDALLEKMGKPRLYTDSEGYFKEQYLWNLLIERISLDYDKKMRDFNGDTIIIEFSRGSEHGGYRSAFKHLSENILKNLAILYIDVIWEESLRKNEQRFNPDRPDSILEHGLPDKKLETLYREIDWEELIEGHSEAITIKGIDVPYVIFDNNDDVTTNPGAALDERLETALRLLWKRKQALG
jgi:hypothetical protein